MLRKNAIKILLFLFFLIYPFFCFADSVGQIKNFLIDSSYDFYGRTKILATLEKVSQNAYFYLEDEWFKNLSEDEKEKIKESLDSLSQEFDNNIYPKVTSLYGVEWKPGIDNDEKITILFQTMKNGVAGYFKSDDEYPKIQAQNSNEREMIYLNINSLSSSSVKSYIAHEFTHLINFNQKERLRGLEEEVWLNEMRAEYAPTLVGYDEEYLGSNLQKRVKDFITSPSDSLTEWQSQKKDYGVINLFAQYLADNYGMVLADSLFFPKIGIASINKALEKNNINKDFSKIFTDWTIAIFLNNCELSEYYCYKNQNLRNLKVTPSLIFLSAPQKTNVSLNYSIKEWSGNWYRIMGGEGDLRMRFDGDDKAQFKVSYVLCNQSNSCSVEFLKLDKEQKGEISFKDFGKYYNSLTLIPSLQSKTEGFGEKEPSFGFSLSVSMENKKINEEILNSLKAQIATLELKIAELRKKIAALTTNKKIACNSFENNLYYGQSSEGVKCLQEFLKNQGPEIYPEGLVSGFFDSLTKVAVIKFQEKYIEEILTPLGLKEGTGFLGPLTRSKINQLLKNN